MTHLAIFAVDASPTTFQVIKIDGWFDREAPSASETFHSLVLFTLQNDMRSR